MSRENYDVVIVGGGMVGASLACALGESTLKVAVIEGEETPLTWQKEGYDIRVSAITRASQQLFEHVGAWQAMAASRIAPYDRMVVWDATGSGHIQFDAAELGEPDLGHIIENRIITAALVKRARACANVQWLCPATPQRLFLRADHAQLHLADGAQLHTQLLVGADGGRSWVRRQAGIEVDTHNYEQTALVTTVKTSRHHANTAWQRFQPSGPLAFLPLTDGYSSIVWSTSSDEAKRLLNLPEADFKLELAAAFEQRLGEITELGERAAFPLKAQHARHYVKPHLALVGDAAHTIHPLAGQGVNLGLADVDALAREILAAHGAHKPIGSLKTLRRFERSRRGDNLLMLESMGAFKQLFSNNNPGLSALRNLGLDLVDQAGPLKHFFAARAMGLSG